MFAGIGGFRSGLTRAGGFRCVGHCEIDKYANASYTAIYEPGKEERYYAEVREDDDEYISPLDMLFKAMEHENPESVALRQYRVFKQAAGKTAKSILVPRRFSP